MLYRGGQDLRADRAPDHGYYAQVKERIDGKRAALSQARSIVRQACTSSPTSATTRFATT